MQRETKIKAAVLIFFILNIIIIGASIHGVSASYQQSAHDAFAVILAFSLISLVLGAAAVYLIHRSQSGGGSKSKKNYDVAGKVNKAFKNDAEAGKDANAEKKDDPKKTGSDEKWVANYVPYGEYPSGKEAAVMESVNEIEVKEREPAPVVTENKNEDAKSSSSSSSSSSSEDEKKDSSKEDKE